MKFVPRPWTFWIWNVPILGTGAHCHMCGALRVLPRLKILAENSHPDLLPHIDIISFEWSAKEVSDYWDESGLNHCRFLNH